MMWSAFHFVDLSFVLRCFACEGEMYLRTRKCRIYYRLDSLQAGVVLFAIDFAFAVESFVTTDKDLFSMGLTIQALHKQAVALCSVIQTLSRLLGDRTAPIFSSYSSELPNPSSFHAYKVMGLGFSLLLLCRVYVILYLLPCLRLVICS